MRHASAAVLLLLAGLPAGCGSFVSLSSGLTGTIAADGPTLGKHQWQVGRCSAREGGARTVVLEVVIGSHSYTVPSGKTSRLVTDYKYAEIEVPADADMKGVEVRFPWSHVTLKRTDCTRFDVRVGSDRNDGQSRYGFIHMSCRVPDQGDTVVADATFRGC